LDYKWLHPEAWNDERLEYFAATSQASFWNLTKSPPFYRDRRRSPPQIEGRWILEDNQTGMQAIAEAVGYYGSYRRCILRISEPEAGWTETFQERLAFLISGLLLMNAADLLYLIPSRSHSLAPLVESGFGVSSQVTTFSREAILYTNGPIIQRQTIIKVDPFSWWESKWGKDNKITLRYLQSRREAEEPKSPKKKKSFSLFGRLIPRGPRK
jgi:hypothetical protein